MLFNPGTYPKYRSIVSAAGMGGRRPATFCPLGVAETRKAVGAVREPPTVGAVANRPYSQSSRWVTTVHRGYRRATFLFEFEDRLIHHQAVAGLGQHLGHHAIPLGVQHILHFHCFDHRQRLAGSDFLTRLTATLVNKPGNSASGDRPRAKSCGRASA